MILAIEVRLAVRRDDGSIECSEILSSIVLPSPQKWTICYLVNHVDGVFRMEISVRTQVQTTIEGFWSVKFLIGVWGVSREFAGLAPTVRRFRLSYTL